MAVLTICAQASQGLRSPPSPVWRGVTPLGWVSSVRGERAHGGEVISNKCVLQSLPVIHTSSLLSGKYAGDSSNRDTRTERHIINAHCVGL